MGTVLLLARAQLVVTILAAQAADSVVPLEATTVIRVLLGAVAAVLPKEHRGLLVVLVEPEMTGLRAKVQVAVELVAKGGAATACKALAALVDRMVGEAAAVFLVALPAAQALKASSSSSICRTRRPSPTQLEVRLRWFPLISIRTAISTWWSVVVAVVVVQTRTTKALAVAARGAFAQEQIVLPLPEPRSRSVLAARVVEPLVS